MTGFVYDSKTSTLIVGVVPMKEFGENKITITRENDVTTRTAGLESNMFSVNNNGGGTISFELIYGTKYDLYMENLMGFKKLIPVSFTDLPNLKNLQTFGMVQTQADIVLGETPDFRTWTLTVDSVDLSIAGQAGELYGTVQEYIA